MTLFQCVHFLGAAFFALAAYVQKNDPDPEIWATIYLLPAFLSLATAIQPEFTESKFIRHVNEMIIVGYCIFGGIILDYSYKFEEDIFHWIIHDEAGREFGGLLIVSLWTGLMHGSSRSATTKFLIMSSMIILVPAIFWGYIYFNKAYRKMWPKHCQTALYPDFMRAS
uniref:Transmembrane protein 220 n=1 Tax=Phallusia mammillata TaxID=59560 RepID=A0A6F9DUG4_9ASCI|nr:transmembrane protein 220 [Phallusia mammillata]